jgi:flavodoxin
MKALVAYYSLSGKTRNLAARLAERLGCDLLELPMFGTRRLDESRKYDVVLVGTPIWLYGPTFPVSRFLSKNKDRLPEVAFFCTYDTSIGRSFEKMGRKCGKKPLGTLKLKGPEIATEAGDLQITQYVDLISGGSGRPGGVPA